MLLRDLVKEIGAPVVEGPMDREITGLAYDSRRVTPGMAFFALPGHNVDGHDFIANAIERGAVAVIYERNGLVSQRATRVRVRCSREALARASAAFYGHPGRKLKVIGVTGTNGKTTVAFMLRQMLQEAGISCGLISTVRYEVGERVIPAHRTTPEAVELQQMLASMVRAGCQACVMEVSSHALQQQRVAGVEFDVAVFTNLSQDHLDFHGSMDAYREAKQRLFYSLRGGGSQGCMVINIDDPHGMELSRAACAEVQLSYGLGDAATLRATQIQLGRTFTLMTMEGPDGRFDCRLPLIGLHNVYNALAATGAGMALGVGPESLQRTLGRLQPIPGRLEAIQQGQSFGVYVDYAHTADALRLVLQTLRQVTAGKLVVVFGCGGSRDTGKRPSMGEVAARMADATWITSDNPRHELPETIATDIERGYQQVRADGCTVELDRRRAITLAIRRAQPGDTVLIAGKGHETYQEFEGVVIPFDDRIYAREALETMGYSFRARQRIIAA